MQKMFVKRLCIMMIIGMLFTIGMNFFILTKNAEDKTSESIYLKLDQISSTIEKNKKSLESLKESINEDYITRARVFAYMIKENPAIIESIDKLEEVKTVLNVDEVHVTDENGILKWGTVTDYYNLDFNSSEQTREFMPALESENFALAQEAQPNGAEQKLFQYISVSRLDKKGIVQIGLVPQRLENAIKQNEIPFVLSQIPMDTNSVLIAVDKQTNNIIYHSENGYLEKNISEIDFPTDYLKKFSKGDFLKSQGVKQFYIFKEYGDIILGIGTDAEAIFADRNSQTIIFAVFMLLVFSFIILQINFMLKKRIVNGIYNIIEALEKITDGNLDIEIKVGGSKEFLKLSDGISKMLVSLKQKIKQSDELMENQNKIIEKVQNTSGELNNCSSEIMEIATQIENGVFEQKNTVEQLESQAKELLSQIRDNAKMAEQANMATKNSQKKLESGKREINAMSSSIEKITDVSRKITSITNTLNQIVKQSASTTMNVTINNVIKLIKDAENEIQTGTNISVSTSNVIQDVIREAERAASSINNISVETSKQLELMDKTNKAIVKISEVTKENEISSQKASNMSDKLYEQVNFLHEVVYQNQNNTLK